MQAPPQPLTPAEMPLQLLLFVDKRPSSREQSRQVQNTLRALRAEYAFELQVIDVGEQPYLAEHFRLVATPALLKIQPEPRQTLAGSNIVAQVEHWWPYWKRSAEDAAGRQEPESILGELELVPEVLDQPSREASSVSDSDPDRSISDKVESVEPGQLTRTASAGSIARSAELIQLSDEVFQLKRDKEELEHQLKFKDQIIAMLAHDLRNPLTAASIALETLEMGHHAQQGWTSKLSPTLTAQLLKHARSQIRSLDRMITDILQAARGASSELQIQPQKLDLGDLCLDVLGTFQDRFQAKLQQVEKDIPSDLPTVLADGERVRQVLTNLLDNAIKYTPVEGTIEVSILHRTTQKIQVSICDNGPGIPEENRERIFEDRFRLKRDEAQEGYGIGLSLCQRIIRAHYGQIWVDSIGNHGSCFHFTLPVFRA